MYYPKSQIKTNLNTKGGFLRYVLSKQEYKGYYFETSTGAYYSGKTPQDPPVLELELIPNNSVEYTRLTNQISVNPAKGDPVIDEAYASDKSDLTNDQISFFILPSSYISSTKIDTTVSPLFPKQTYPIPTDNDYKLGEFQRYFLKKGNEIKFLEISLEDYRKYVNRDKDVMFELYTPIQINWILTGEEKQVYQVNQSIVARAEREQNLPGFTQYFRGKFTQFYK
jgi:hypothetical protein